jgi:hypothetical protein
MHNCKTVFVESLVEARNLDGLFAFLSQTINVPFPFDDLLRAQVVNVMSAYDKLVHDLIRIGMMQIFVGARPPTLKYQSEAISLQVHSAIMGATLPPKEIIFEAEVVRKLGYISFQDPTKLAEGLSLIWDEPHKWEKIAGVLGTTGSDARTKMKVIAVRRNAIVHEADTDLISGRKRPISQAETADITEFVEKCGNAIVGLVN